MNWSRQKIFQLIFGLFGINICFLIVGILYEKIATRSYINISNNQSQFIKNSAGIIFVYRGFNWLFAELYQRIMLPDQKKVNIPIKSTIMTGFLTYLSSITQTQAMFLMSYPFVVMTKTSSLIPGVLVGIFYLIFKKNNKRLSLGPQKIMVVTSFFVGIIIFKLVDPISSILQNPISQWTGIFLLLISLFADGLISNYHPSKCSNQQKKPSQIQLLIDLNKSLTIYCFLQLLFTNKFFEMIDFLFDHVELVQDLLIMSISAFIGQLIIYRITNKIQYYTVSLIVTSRKIQTVGLSIIIFDHVTNIGQIIAISILFLATFYQFFDELSKDLNQNNKNYKLNNKNINFNQNNFISTSQQPINHEQLSHNNKLQIVLESQQQQTIKQQN